MARMRTLKPGFFQNDVLAELEPLARLLFAGLWTLADRAGRLEDRPKRIKVELLPYDDCDVENLLTQIAEHNFIYRYQVNGNRYIQIVNFDKHQSPHIKEPPSTIPAPDKHQTSTILAGTQKRQTTHTLKIPKPDTRPVDSLGEKAVENAVTETDDNYNENNGVDLAPDKHGAGTIQAPCKNPFNSNYNSKEEDSLTRGTAKPRRPPVPPQIEFVRSLMFRYPDKALWPQIVQVVGDEVDADRLGKCYSEWVGRGFNKMNFAWLFDWYVNGIPSSKGAANEKNQPRRFETREERNDRHLEATFRQIAGIADPRGDPVDEPKALPGDSTDYHKGTRRL